MDATERGAHFGTESFGDIVSGDPASGAIAERQGHVRRIRLRANNNDSLRWEVIRLATAALWKGCAVDDHEVWREVVHRGWEIPVEQTGLPTAVFSFEGDLPTAMHDLTPDLVIIDGAAFPQCCCGQSDDFPTGRIVVIGPEPDPAYMTLALGDGAGGWVARDDVAEGLSAEMRTALGCIHEPCPPHSTIAGRKESVDHRTFNR